jgi:hypothetical protein
LLIFSYFAGCFRSLLSGCRTPGWRNRNSDSGFFSIVRAAVSQMNDKGREDRGEERGDEGHCHSRHVLEVLTVEQVVNHAPDCRSEEHDETDKSQQNDACLAATANLSTTQLERSRHHSAARALYYGQIGLSVQTGKRIHKLCIPSRRDFPCRRI